MLRRQNPGLGEALAQGRGERAEEVAAIRAERDAEVGTLRKESAELRDRIDKQWEMEDELRTRYADKQVDIEKTKVAGRILGALGEAGVAQLFPKGTVGQRNIRQPIPET